MHPMNLPAKFQVCSCFTRSWVNRG